jgi:hypothetical protein
MLFWTREGYIKKIIIRQISPDIAFWLTQKQLELLGQDAVLKVRVCGACIYGLW